MNKLLSKVLISFVVMVSPIYAWADALADDHGKMVINEVNVGGLNGKDSFVELYLVSAMDLSSKDYQLCIYENSNETCTVLGAGESYSEWNTTGRLDNNGPNADADAFNAGTYLIYDFEWLNSGTGFSTTNITEFYLVEKVAVGNKGKTQNKSLDYLCYAPSGDSCNGTPSSYNPSNSDPNTRTKLENVTPPFNNFVRQPDGSGSVTESAGEPTRGSSNNNVMSCANLFDDAITTHGSSGQLLFPAADSNSTARIYDSPDFDFAANNINYAWNVANYETNPSGWTDANPSSGFKQVCASSSGDVACTDDTDPIDSLTLANFQTTSHPHTLTVSYKYWPHNDYVLEYFDGTNTVVEEDLIWGNQPDEIQCDFNSISITGGDNSGAELELSDAHCSQYNINNLTISRYQTNLILNNGQFWVDNWSVSAGQAGKENSIEVASGKKSSVYVNSGTGSNALIVEQFTQLNMASIGNPNDEGKLTIISYGDVSIKGGEISAFVYANGQIHVDDLAVAANSGEVFGALTGSDIALSVNTSVTFDASEAGTANIPGICDASPVVSSSVDHFSIFSVANDVQICDGAVNVSIQANDSADSAVNDFTGSIEVSTFAAKGTWAKQAGAKGTLSVSVNGVVTYQYHADDNGIALLALTLDSTEVALASESININVKDTSDNSITETSGAADASDDQSIVFNECIAGFAISSPASVVNCSQADIQFTAVDDNGNALTQYNELVNLSTSTNHGDWAKVAANGALVQASENSGSATYQFENTDNGVMTLSLSNTHVEPVTVTIQQASDNSVIQTSSTIEFTQAGFILIDNVGNEVSANTLLEAGSASQSYAWQAVKTSDDSQACESYFPQASARDLNLGSTCDNPSTCQINQQVHLSINGAGYNAIANPENLISAQAMNPVSVNFAANSITDAFTFKYYDVGQITLKVNHDLGNSHSLSGEKTFIVYPHQLELTVSDSNPAKVAALTDIQTATIGKYKKAGERFNVTITALSKNSAGTGTQAAPNFGSESAIQTLALSHSLIAPLLPVSSGTLTAGTLAKNGSGYEFTGASFSEVGAITLTATLSDYLSQPNLDVSIAQNVGRFYPASFSAAYENNLATPTSEIILGNANSSCTTAFTYQGQTVDFANDYHPTIKLTALNTQGDAVQNYTVNSQWWKLNGQSIDLENQVSGGNSATFATSGTVLIEDTGSANFSNEGAGITSISMNDIEVTWIKSGTPDTNDEEKPMQIDISIAAAAFEDSDGACIGGNQAESNCQVFTINNIAGIDLHYGRMVLENTAGSELSHLYMLISFEHYVNGGFERNLNDNCSIYLLQTSHFSASESPTHDDLDNSDVDFNSISALTRYLVINPTGENKTGAAKISADLQAANLMHLKYDFSGDGNYDNPYAQATFGIWQGRQKAGEKTKLLFIQRGVR